MTEDPTRPVPGTSVDERPGDNSWMRHSIALRAAVAGGLGLLMLIPLMMVQGLIKERETRKQEAQAEVSGTWGGPQTIIGPVVSVPYDEFTEGDGERTAGNAVRRYVHFLPETLSIHAGIEPERRHRGVYDVVVYRGRMTLSGRFKPLAESGHHIEGRPRWADAMVTVGVSDLRSVREQVRMRIGERELAFEPGAPTQDVTDVAVSAPLALDSAAVAEGMSFTMGITVHGSSFLRMVPVGRVTHATMASPWPDPSFQGAFLPDSSSIGPKGSSASWTVLHLNRPYPQVFVGNRAHQLAESAFGADLVLPVDEYRKSDRAAKYGMLLIGLVFMVFFFTEVLLRLRIHPVQYLLVGLALCVFYALLIALAEHIGFGAAYAVSALAVTGLVVFYASSVFRVPRATRTLAVVLVLVYGFVLTIILQEGYSLLMGSIGLFVALAVAMVLSRKVDWSGGREGLP